MLTATMPRSWIVKDARFAFEASAKNGYLDWMEVAPVVHERLNQTRTVNTVQRPRALTMQARMMIKNTVQRAKKTGVWIFAFLHSSGKRTENGTSGRSTSSTGGKLLFVLMSAARPPSSMVSNRASSAGASSSVLGQGRGGYVVSAGFW
jgi:hypothetical protein